MKITKRQLSKLVNNLMKEQFNRNDKSLVGKQFTLNGDVYTIEDTGVDKRGTIVWFQKDGETKWVYASEIEDMLTEQFEWDGDEGEDDEWFADFTSQMTGVEDEGQWEDMDDDDRPYNDEVEDEFIGKADRSERFVQETKKKKKQKSPAQKVRKPTAPPSKQHKDPTQYDRKVDKKKTLEEVGPYRASSGLAGHSEQAVSSFVQLVENGIKKILGRKWSSVEPELQAKLGSVLRQIGIRAFEELDDLDLD